MRCWQGGGFAGRRPNARKASTLAGGLYVGAFDGGLDRVDPATNFIDSENLPRGLGLGHRRP